MSNRCVEGEERSSTEERRNAEIDDEELTRKGVESKEKNTGAEQRSRSREPLLREARPGAKRAVVASVVRRERARF